MKLVELAERARKLPDCDAFDWPGEEQFSGYNFTAATATLPEVVKYVDALRKRMAAQSLALTDLAAAYRQMRDLLLEFEVTRDAS